VLPAGTDELERVNLELELVRREHAVEQMRNLLSEEETAQQMLTRRIEEQLGPRRREIGRLKAEVERLEHRLDRLSFYTQVLSEEELDQEEEAARAEEAAFWAEWRHNRNGRRESGAELVRQNGHDDIMIRHLYRALARVVHPDLARNEHEKAQREVLMRLANLAHEAGDADQLQRLLAIWSRPEEGDRPRDVEALRARIAQRRVEYGEIRRQLAQMRQTMVGRLLRLGERDIRHYLRVEEVRLGRELAVQRLRRRRVLRLLEDRKRNLSVPARE
jgi:hypothetical protein